MSKPYKFSDLSEEAKYAEWSYYVTNLRGERSYVDYCLFQEELDNI